MEGESRFGKLQSLAGVFCSLLACLFVFSAMSSALSAQRALMLNTYDDLDSYSAISTQASKDENFVPQSHDESESSQSLFESLFGSHQEGSAVSEETADDEASEVETSSLADTAANKAGEAVSSSYNLYADTLNGEGPAVEAEQTVLNATLGSANDYIESHDLNDGGLASKFDFVFAVFLILAILCGGGSLLSGVGSSGGSQRPRSSGNRPSGNRPRAPRR